MNIPKFITRQFIREHPEINFIYGDTIHHDGNGKQARQARGETNAYPLPVKLRKCYNDEGAFISDYFFESVNKPLIDGAISKIPTTNLIIFFPKIGAGFNEMEKRAPQTYMYLMSQLFEKFKHLAINAEVVFIPSPLIEEQVRKHWIIT